MREEVEIVEIITRLIENDIDIGIQIKGGKVWILDRTHDYVRVASKMIGGETLFEALRNFDEEIKLSAFKKRESVISETNKEMLRCGKEIDRLNRIVGKGQ